MQEEKIEDMNQQEKKKINIDNKKEANSDDKYTKMLIGDKEY